MLIDDYMTDCVMLAADSVSDGEGGQKQTFRRTVSFRAAVVQNAAAEARKAEKTVSDPGYTVTMPKTAPLKYGSIFQRREDGAVFRLTGDPREMRSPMRATFSLMQAPAERWEVEE